MVKKFRTYEPQLVLAEQTAGSVVVLTNEQKLSLYKKSQKSAISTDILEEVYRRGYSIWNESFGQTAEQFAFDRVNSFIAGGFAADLDDDLLEKWSDSKYKNPEGGLTKAGVMAYRRENPGSKLKTAVRTEPSKLKPGSKSANRRKSFCARMTGMKKRLTSSKTANDPDSRINKSLRAWHCEETQINEKTCDCWDGYKRVPGTKPCTSGSCAKPSEINEKRGLWDNIHAKRARIKAGSGERMRKPGSEGAPTEISLKNSQNEEKKIHIGKHFKTSETVEKQSKNPNDSDSRFDGTKSGKNVYQKATPGQPVTESLKSIIRRVIFEKTELKGT
jgi:hypothetical protein